jgi:2-oxoisovalerate dehydrogenase E2 component (dihydrolipoyl transacylase)
MPRVREFALPDLGEGLTEAQVLCWLVNVGDAIEVDQPVAEVETVKAVIEMPCPFAGVVFQIHADVGGVVAVGRPLISVLVEKDENDDREVDSGGPREHRKGQPDGPERMKPQSERSDGLLVGYGISEPPRRRGRAGAARSYEAARVVSPAVRLLARLHGLDLSEVVGSGPQGLIGRVDVEREVALRTRSGNSAAPAPTAAECSSMPAASAAAARSSATCYPAGERIRLHGARAVAAAKFSRSRSEVPDVTIWVDADATELVAARQRSGVGLLGLFAQVCLSALAGYPQFNAEFDPARGEVVRKRQVGLGFAAQSPGGLVVPVVHGAESLRSDQFVAELTRLTRAAREGGLTPGELTGGTFTLNNYGVFGIDGATPILNLPEAAMLGVGRITDKPWAHEGRLEVRKVVQLTLTFDHRVCDGAEAGGFLRCIADAVEQPAPALLQEP